MPYIGRAATNTGNVRYLDNIASGFDGSDVTFTAQVGGVSITPDQENVRIYLDGVFQHPGSGNAYTISGSTITFTEAPVANTVFSAYVVGAGSYLDDKAVTSAKLDDDAVVAAKLDDDGTGFQVGDLGVGGSLTSGDKLTVTGRLRASGGIIGDLTGDVTGDLTGNVTGNTSGTAATVTGAAQSAITSVGTLSSLTLGGDLTIPQKIVHSGDTDTYLSFGTDSLSLYTGGTNVVDFIYGNIYIKGNNKALVGYNASSSAKELIKIDGSNVVQIAEGSDSNFGGAVTSSGAGTFTSLDIGGASDIAGNLTLSGSSTTRYLFLNSGGNGGVWQEGNYELRFGTNDNERMKIESDGTVVMNGALQPAGNVTIGGNLTVNGTGSDVITGDYLYLDAHNNTAAKNIVFRKNDDTWLGQIEFHPTNKGWITTRVDQPLAFGTNNNEMLYLDTAGNLGLGSGSNTNARIVRGFSANKGLVIETAQPAIQFVDTADTNNYYTQAYDNGTMYFYNDAAGDVIFSTNSAQKFTIQSDQATILAVKSYVVGTSQPTQTIRFQGHHAGFGDGLRTFSQIRSRKSNSTGGSVAGELGFFTNETDNSLNEWMRIDYEGKIHMYNLYGRAVGGTNRDVYIGDGGDLGYLSSVREHKMDIKSLSDVTWLSDLNPVSFYRRNIKQDGTYGKTKDGSIEYGLIADEVEKVNKDFVFYDIDEDENKVLAGVEYRQLIIPMLKKIQELSAKVEELENA
jgi:hypothetical protein